MRRTMIFLNPLLIHNEKRRAQVEQIAEILSANGGDIHLQETLSAHSAGQQAAVVSAAGMRSLPSAQTYQLWVMGPDGSARSAGLLSRTGRAGPVLASGVVPGDRIGITVEPAGGTSSPTTTPVLAVPV